MNPYCFVLRYLKVFALVRQIGFVVSWAIVESCFTPFVALAHQFFRKKPMTKVLLGFTSVPALQQG